MSACDTAGAKSTAAIASATRNGLFDVFGARVRQRSGISHFLEF
jgi:hypothetical protein